MAVTPCAIREVVLVDGYAAPLEVLVQAWWFSASGSALLLSAIAVATRNSVEVLGDLVTLGPKRDGETLVGEVALDEHSISPSWDFEGAIP